MSKTTWMQLFGLLVAALCPAAAVASEPLTPAEVVEGLATHNPSLRAALADLERARLAVVGEEHRYRPTLSITAGLTRTETPSLSTAGVLVGSLNVVSLVSEATQRLSVGTEIALTLDLSWTEQEFAAPFLQDAVPVGPGYGVETRLSLTQPFLRDFGTDVGEAQLKSARANLSGEERSRLQTASELVLETLSGYWDLWLAQESLRISEQARDVAQAQLDDAVLRAQTGDLAPLDVLPLRTELASAEESLASARASIVTAWLDLARLTGQPIDVAGLRGVSGPPPVGEPGPSAEEAGVLAVESAYEIGVLEAALAAARVELAVAENQAAPRLDVQAWVSLQGLGDGNASDALRQVADLDAVSAFVGVAGELDFDRTRRKSEVARARFAVSGAQQRLLAAQAQARTLAVQLVSRIEAARTRASLTETTVAVATQSLRGQEVRFKTGAGTTLELVVAQQQLREAELRLAQARVELTQADLQLKHATGRLLDTFDWSER